MGLSKSACSVYKIMAGDKDITSNIKEYLLDLVIIEKSGFGSDQLVMVLEDKENLIEVPTTGKMLKCYLGQNDDSIVCKGSFIVDELKFAGFPKTITIIARSANFRQNMHQKKDVSYDNMTLTKICSAIALCNGFNAVIDPVLGNEMITHIDQKDESDLAFLKRIAEERDALIKFRDNNLYFVCHSQEKSISGKKMPVYDINLQNVTMYECTIADRENYKSVTASYYDKNLAKKITVAAGAELPVLQCSRNF